MFLIRDEDNQIKDMAWKFAGRMRIWGGELILYYSVHYTFQ